MYLRKIILWIAFLIFASSSFAQDSGFTQEDREKLARLEATLKTFMEQVDKRFSELREDMNKRFEQIDKRFEQIDKRFEQIDKRFEQMMTFLWILVGIFTSLVVAVIGFAYWDRRTIVKRARDEAIEVIEREGKLIHVIKALRELATEDKRVAEILKTFGLL